MNTGKSRWRSWEVALISISIVLAVIIATAMVIISAMRPLSPLEAVLFQLLALSVGLGGGLYGSYKFGQNSATNTQYARSALRSVMVLYRSIRGLYNIIQQLTPQESDRAAILQLLVTQLDVAQSAIADWRDVIPDDFENVEETLEQPDFRRNLGNDNSNGTDSR